MQRSVIGTVTRGTSGTGGSTTTTDPRSLVVGAWKGSATRGATPIEFICPQGRLRGYEKIKNLEFIDCGTWTISNSRLTATYKATAVADPTVVDRVTSQFDHLAATDQLQWVGTCPVKLSKLVGGVTEADCTTGTCTAGGSGAITGCGADSDCGRCLLRSRHLPVRRGRALWMLRRLGSAAKQQRDRPARPRHLRR